MNNTIPSKYQGRSLEDLKSSLRAINHKINSMRMDAAIIVGVLPLKPGRKFWIATEINWDDPKLNHLRETFFDLVKKSNELTRIIGYLEATQKGKLPEWEADEKILQFLSEHFNSFEEEVEFFKKNNLHMGTSSLKEKILKNPNYLQEEVIL